MSSEDPELIGLDIDAVLARIGAAVFLGLALPMGEAFLAETATDPISIGSALARHREHPGLTLEQQAELLGIGIAGLAILALCRLPRRQHWERDLHNASRWSGENPGCWPKSCLPTAWAAHEKPLNQGEMINPFYIHRKEQQPCPRHTILMR